MKFIDLFAGIGGFSLGLERAGMKCVGQVEIDPFCNRVLAKHWPDVPRWKDIRDFAGTECGTVQLVCGGFPCQPFSVAGHKRGDGDDRYLWPEMLRVIQAARPAWVFGENVANIANLGLDTLHAQLEAIGYSVQLFDIPACAIDAPHRRERIFILAHAAGADNTQSRLETCTEWGASAQPRGFCCHPRRGIQIRWPLEVESRMVRMADGIPKWLDKRLKAIGNAVVPPLIEAIGHAILMAQNEFEYGSAKN